MATSRSLSGKDYPERVRNDLHLSLNRKSLPLRLISADIPARNSLGGRVGQMQWNSSPSCRPRQERRRLVLENRHQTRIAAYLVNNLATSDPDIRLLAQRRNVNQSFYQLDYVQAGGCPGHRQSIERASEARSPKHTSYRGRRRPSSILTRTAVARTAVRPPGALERQRGNIGQPSPYPWCRDRLHARVTLLRWHWRRLGLVRVSAPGRRC